MHAEAGSEGIDARRGGQGGISMENVRNKLLEEILWPEAEFTPMPFWFFNDAFDEEKVRNQLEDYVEKGVNGFVLHPRIGIPEQMPYLSGEYFRAVRFIVATAAALGMKVVLYDEGMYPSGSAHGMVAEADPAYAAKGIILLEEREALEKLGAEPGARVVASLPGGRRIVYGFTGGTIRGIHFGEDDGEPGAPKAADILNPLAVEEFIRLTHDRYYEELKEYFGTTVIGFFTDEPSALGRGAGYYRPWVPGLEKELEALGGSAEELEGLFARTGKTVAGREDILQTEDNRTVQLYHRLIKKKLREIFYGRLSEWCGSHGISLMGHPAESDDIEEELYFHVPGQDLIMRRVSPETGGLREFDSVQAKLAADIARHLGRRRNANECFGVCCRDRIPWYMTAGDMKWYIDWLGLRGVNLYIPHAFYYSVAGERKNERPPDVGPNNIWWRHYKRFSDYMKRLSFLMTDSVNGAETAVLCDNNLVPYGEIACFYENQVEFNYLPAALLEQAQVREGRVRIGDYAYKRVLNLLGEAYEDRFRARLGNLLCTVSAEEVPRLAAVIVGEEKASGRKAVLEAPCGPLRMVRLNKWGTELLLFGNEGEKTVSAGVRVPGMEEPLLVDLWKGSCHRLEGAGEHFWISLQPRETVLVMDAGKGGPSTEGAAGKELPSTEGLAVEGAAGRKPGRLREGFTERCALGERCAPAGGYPDWTERFTLTERGKNQAVYVLEYRWKRSWEALADSGTGFQVRGREMVECFCNGRFVDVSFWGKHRFDLGGFLQEGRNEIRLVCTGNAANLYEDAGIDFGLGAE